MATALCISGQQGAGVRPISTKHAAFRTSSTGRLARRSAVVVRASAAPRVPPPEGVTLPPLEPSVPQPRFGFVNYAETLNSRAAMIGFFALLAVEGIAGKGLLELLGVQIGNGLGFEL